MNPKALSVKTPPLARTPLVRVCVSGPHPPARRRSAFH
jgi:hypothetical protein